MRILIAIALVTSLLGVYPTEVPAQDQEPAYVMSRSRVQLGDDVRWAAPDFADQDWQNFEDWYYAPAADTSGLFWLRIAVDVNEEKAVEEKKGLGISILGAFEVYWDGHLIGQSGQVGSNLESEIPGQIDNLFLIPDSLYTQGNHALALRVSTFQLQRKVRYYIHGIAIGSYQEMAQGMIRVSMLPLFFLGGFVIIAIYYLLLYLVTTRRLAYLLFSLLCFSVSILLVVESWRWVFGYTFDWHYPRLVAVILFTFIVSVLLPFFFMTQFSFPKKKWFLGGLSLALLLAAFLPRSFDAKSEYLFWIAFALSIGVVLWAVIQKKEGSWLALIGVGSGLSSFFPQLPGFHGITFFLSFGVLIVFLLASLSLQSKKLREQHEQALVNAARLEIELLKKNIQPHFLMNTLTSVMEWIEEDPRTGVKFMEALADELRILSEVSDKKLIAIAQELDLCRSHLEIMSYRKAVRFNLIVDDINYDDMVPPALFHTLIENGITHNAFDTEVVSFRLTGEVLSQGRRYVLLSRTNGTFSTNGYKEGTGLRYIKARLEESFGTQWEVTSGLSEKGWETVIDIYG